MIDQCEHDEVVPFVMHSLSPDCASWMAHAGLDDRIYGHGLRQC